MVNFEDRLYIINIDHSLFEAINHRVEGKSTIPDTLLIVELSLYGVCNKDPLLASIINNASVFVEPNIERE